MLISCSECLNQCFNYKIQSVHAACPESGVATDAVYGTPSAGGGQGGRVLPKIIIYYYYHYCYHNNYYNIGPLYQISIDSPLYKIRI